MEIAGYSITRCIAQGGMAAAYLAEQQSLQRTVVLKVLDTRGQASPLALQRFVNEGKLLAALQHPHVITLYDIGAADGLAYLSMEYVPGGDLKRRIAQGGLDPLQALDILEQIARGLGAAHARGIVHRDVKPANVLFRADGTAVLSDFGIAKSLATDANVTSKGVFVGSPNYMAPEQAEAAEIDHRTDIYALGVIFYEMLTGQKPYQSESVVEVIHRHRTAPIPRLPAGLAVFQEMIDLMLAKERSQRFRDIPAVLHFLSLVRARWQAQAAQHAAATPYGTPARLVLESPPRRERRMRLALLGVLGLALAGHALLLYLDRREENARVATTASQVDPAALAAVDAALARPATANPVGGGTEPSSVIAALVWLGQSSLAEGRLIAPAEASAYYYFRRALQIAPDDVQALAGLEALAEHYTAQARQAATAGNPSAGAAALQLARRIRALDTTQPHSP
jgi:tRNA A-37 threonylcarbamoyl transferase component Bud32